jgi:8-oxo-dGTP pyrophosphatase MutT (NUDIX family)
MDLSSHGIVALVRNQNGKFLLLEDGRAEMYGHWAPPHGRCESTDASEEAGVVRETFEETGLQVEPVRKVLTQAADTKVKTVSFWLVDTLSTQVNLDTEESSDYGWFTIEEALKLTLYPGTKLFFEKVLRDEVKLS